MFSIFIGSFIIKLPFFYILLYSQKHSQYYQQWYRDYITGQKKSPEACPRRGNHRWCQKAFITHSAELVSHSNGFDQSANELAIKCCLKIDKKFNSNMLCFYEKYLDDGYVEGDEIIYKKIKLKEYLQDIEMI